jgi:SsrA-binding protein
MADKTEREKRPDQHRREPQGVSRLPPVESFEGGAGDAGYRGEGDPRGAASTCATASRASRTARSILYNVNISPYSHRATPITSRCAARKLLLHREEIRKLVGKTVEKGMTLVPVRLYSRTAA